MILEIIIQCLHPDFNCHFRLLEKNKDMFTEPTGYISKLLSIMRWSTFSICYKTLCLIQRK